MQNAGWLADVRKEIPRNLAMPMDGEKYPAELSCQGLKKMSVRRTMADVKNADESPLRKGGSAHGPTSVSVNNSQPRVSNLDVNFLGKRHVHSS